LPLPIHVFKDFVSKARADTQEKLKELVTTNMYRDRKVIDTHKKRLEKLDALYAKDEVPLQLVKRPTVAGSRGGEMGVKFVAKDEDTQAALSSMMEGKSGDADVRALLKEMVNNPELKFKPRARKTKRLNASLAGMPYYQQIQKEEKAARPVIEVSMN